ncbi:hypothetical protein DFH06DRAFT_603434 [Mycena polygramma]|nr:hypothetical protein DFH06DRAFT_603434 [Mycena polygramma]
MSSRASSIASSDTYVEGVARSSRSKRTGPSPEEIREIYKKLRSKNIPLQPGLQDELRIEAGMSEDDARLTDDEQDFYNHFGILDVLFARVFVEYLREYRQCGWGTLRDWIEHKIVTEHQRTYVLVDFLERIPTRTWDTLARTFDVEHRELERLITVWPCKMPYLRVNSDGVPPEQANTNVAKADRRRRHKSDGQNKHESRSHHR